MSASCTAVAFIDEFGNTDLDLSKEGPTSHFIICAIIVDDTSKVPGLSAHLSRICKKHFGGGAMSSRSVGSDDNRRKKVLRCLKSLSFTVYASVVDKSRIRSEALKYHGTFYKFLYGRVEKRLMETHPFVQIVADQYGTDEFMKSFANYINLRYEPRLFEQSRFSFKFVEKHPLLDLADFVAGTIARAYDHTVASNIGQLFLKELQPKTLAIDLWPYQGRAPYTSVAPSAEDNLQDVIAQQAVSSAKAFSIAQGGSKDPLAAERVKCVEHLLLYATLIDPLAYVSSAELMEQIRGRRRTTMTERHLRSRIIAKIRDAGVLVSSSNKGYKLPCSKSDLLDFVDHSMCIIVPMIDRIARCRATIKLATNGQLDILGANCHAALRAAIDVAN